MGESKMAKFKIAAIIKLCEKEWVKFFGVKLIQVWVRVLFKMAESKIASWQFKMAAIIKLSENEGVRDWISLSQSFVQNCWIQDG